MNKIVKDAKEQQLYVSRKIIYDANNYINNQIDISKVLIKKLYTGNQELQDTDYYLNHSYEDYAKYRLDRFLSSDKVFYRGIDWYVKEWYAYNDNIEDIAVYSYKNSVLTLFDDNGNSQRIPVDNFEINDGDNAYNTLLKIIDHKNKKEKRDNFYSISYIRNPYTLDNIGFFIMTYGTDKLDELIEKYDAKDHKLMLLTTEGYALYDSSKKYEGNMYPYIYDLVSNDRGTFLDEKCYLNFAHNLSKTILVSAVPEALIFKKAIIPVVSILIISIILIIIGEGIVYLRIRKLGHRTQNIINAMDSLKEGNFDISIPTGNEDDELNLIAETFNDTCKTLDEYIKKVYLAEIKQKKSEMDMLQTRINPHFLYNTLESIRMKAIVNGDREVGKMLYNLASLFRNMIKGENIITLSEELYFCKMFLELHKFRYDDKFEYCIDYDSDILSYKIIKLIIQPVIENYLVHGIDLEREDNFLMITAEKIDNDLLVTIEDNGKGIEEGRLKNINSSLTQGVKNGDSIGLLNTHERIVLEYGKEYGITLKNKKLGGTEVSIKIPAMGGSINV